MPKMSKSQAELLEAMNKGVRVFRSSGYPKYWYREDTHAKCTATADALRERGVANFAKNTELPRFADAELCVVNQPVTQG